MARTRTKPPEWEKAKITVLKLSRAIDAHWGFGPIWAFDGFDQDDAAEVKLAELEADAATSVFFNDPKVWLKTLGGGYIRATSVEQITPIRMHEITREKQAESV